MRELNVKSKYYLSYQLQIFADGPGGEKTEEATTKKLDEARKDGSVARSNELNIGIALVTIFLCLKIFISYIGNGLVEGFFKYYSKISSFVNEPMLIGRAHTLITDVIKSFILIVIPIFIITNIVTFVTVLVQVKWKVSSKPLMPKFDKLNPIKGFKKIFNKDKIFELVKSIVKIFVVFYMVYNELQGDINFLGELYAISLKEAISLIGSLVLNLGLKISFLYVVIGLVDYIYQIRKFKKEMRMTKQELKDEYKQTEGDPKIKGRIRQKMQEISNKRMMKQLPEADVVITNPTHLAVAIKYDKSADGAPVVIAKGADHLAAKIREVARENKIEIVENKPLARMLYFNVEIGQEVPRELYQMVAEVLAYVYRLKNQ